MRTLAHWCVRHRRFVLGSWIAALVIIGGLSSSIGTEYRNTFSLKGTQSIDAQNLIKSAVPSAAGDTDQIVLHTDSGTVTGAAVQQRVASMLAKVASLPHVSSVVSPYSARGTAQVSVDRKTAFAQVTFDQQGNELPKSSVKTVISTAEAARQSGLDVELGGQAIEVANQQGLGFATGLGIIAAAVILFFAFGSFFAMLLPLVSAIFALGVGLSLIGFLSHGVDMADFASELATLIGLGVGVDYALFIVTRYRQGLRRGLDVETAVVEAVNTSGRAVLFAGITVCIALLGLFTLGVSFLYGVALAASLAVLMTMLSSVTLLPALLAMLKTRALSRKDRARITAGELTTTDESPGWARWAARMQRRPGVLAGVAALVMVLIAIPFFSLRLGLSDQGNDPTKSTTRKAYNLLADGFGPGFNGPLSVVAKLSGPQQQAQLTRAVAALDTDESVAKTVPPVLLGDDVYVATVYPKGAPQDKDTSDLVHRLRDGSFNAQTAAAGIHAYVGGETAIGIDFASVLANKLPLFIGVVVLLSFLLLAAVFRSLVVPLTAAVMNILSAGAAFGVIVAVFQKGWGASLIGVSRTGPIDAFIPVMMFAILFGLSMDYQVFLVTRIHEEWLHRRDNGEAVRHGLAATGQTITAAAAIMVLVFAAFILGDVRVIKLFGLGLASAVLLDALIVRSVIVPGVMFLAGRSNWWLPGWVDRILPSIDVEGGQDSDSGGERLPVAVGGKG